MNFPSCTPASRLRCDDRKVERTSSRRGAYRRCVARNSGSGWSSCCRHIAARNLALGCAFPRSKSAGDARRSSSTRRHHDCVDRILPAPPRHGGRSNWRLAHRRMRWNSCAVAAPFLSARDRCHSPLHPGCDGYSQACANSRAYPLVWARRAVKDRPHRADRILHAFRGDLCRHPGRRAEICEDDPHPGRDRSAGDARSHPQLAPSIHIRRLQDRASMVRQRSGRRRISRQSGRSGLPHQFRT